MDVSNQFIKYVKFDDEKRILVAVQLNFQSYLQDDKNRQMLKKFVLDLLKEDFIKLEIGKNLCRITVKEGTEEDNLQRVQTELMKGLEIAMKIMANK